MTQSPENRIAIQHAFSRLMGIAAIAMACFALVGWILGSKAVVGVLPGSVPMHPITALLLALGAVALLLPLILVSLAAWTIYRAIAARAAAEEALLQAGGPLQVAIFNSATFSSIATDARGVIQIFNVGAERMLGYTAAEVVNRITPADLSDPQELIARANALSLELGTSITPGFEALAFKASRGIGDIYELTYVRKDGSRFPAVVSVTALRDAQEGIIGYLLIGTDNTARKRIESRFHRLIDSNVQGVMFWNVSGQITNANDEFLRIVGRTRDDLEAGRLDWLKMTPSEYAEIDRHALEEIAVKTFCTPIEKEYIRQDGSRIPVLIGAAVFEDNPQEGVCFVLDRTESQRAEAAAVLLAAIVESSTDAVIGKDLNGVVTSWNAAAERIFGYPPDEMVGQSITRIIPEDRHDDEELILSRINRGERVEHFETERLKKDGSVIAVSVTVSPIKDSHGRVIGASKVARDITERKRAAQALRASEGRLKMVTDNARVGLVMVDRERRYTFANSTYADILGLASPDIVGQRVADVLATRYEDQIRPHLDRAFAGERVAYELRGATSDDVRRYAVRYEPSMVDGSVSLVVVVITDITERKQAEAQVRQLNTDLEQRVVERTQQLQTVNSELEAFSYSVSHDLRAPLRTLDGFSQALLEDYSSKLDARGQEYLARVRAGSQRMGHLIDDLLSLSRVARGEMSRELVDLSRMAHELAEELRVTSPQRDVEFVVADGLTADTDPRLMRIVLTNLLGNAWKFTGKRPHARIEFGSSEENGRNEYFMRDNGAGFDPAYSERLFGAFQRLHSTKDFAGTGIGLATVQRIILRHGGRIWAEGKVDRGATFHFTLSGASNGYDKQAEKLAA